MSQKGKQAIAAGNLSEYLKTSSASSSLAIVLQRWGRDCQDLAETGILVHDSESGLQIIEGYHGLGVRQTPGCMPAIQQSLVQLFKVFRGQDVVENIDHHKLNNPSLFLRMLPQLSFTLFIGRDKVPFCGLKYRRLDFLCQCWGPHL
jgi:hypothetical protein